MNKLIVSLKLAIIISTTLTTMDKTLQTQLLRNTTKFPYRYHRYNVPYYKHNRNSSYIITTIENKALDNQNNSFIRYLNNKNVMVPVPGSVNNGVYRRTKYEDTNTKVYYNMTSTTDNYNENNIWNVDKRVVGSQPLKNNTQNVTRLSDFRIVVVDRSNNKTSNRLDNLCGTGCASGWTPVPGDLYSHTKKYDVTTDNSVFVRLKSYMNYDNQTKTALINTYRNKNDSFGVYIKDNRSTILNKIEKYKNQPIKTVSIYDNIQYMYPPYQTINYDEDNDVINNFNRSKTSLIGYTHGDSSTSGTRHHKNIFDGRKLYPDRSYYYSDYDYHKWYYNDPYSEKYSDPRSWNGLKEHYYCKKYCHCCKEHEGYHVTHGVLGSLIHFLKNFGFNSGYDFFYGRSVVDDYNPLMYVTNLYRRFNDYHDYDQDFDESFVYFDHDHGEPDHVADCKDLCSCCHTEVVVKLKKKLDALKWKRVNTKRLQRLISALTHLVSDDDCGDDCYDDYETDRSLDERYDPGGYDHIDEIYEPDHIYDHAEDDHGYVYSPHHHHPHQVEHHHYFDCSKCCRFCKKTTIKVVKAHGKKKHRKWHRKRLHKKGLWRSIKHLLRHKIPGLSIEEEDDDDDDDNRGSNSDNQCCNNMSGVKVLVVVVIVAIIIIQSFSSVNIIIAVIIPIIFFGVIIILVFILLQAIVPIYFIPIIVIALIVIAAPVLLIIAVLLLILPIILMPIFLPFMLRMNGTTPYPLPNITCTRPFTLPVNCTIGYSPFYQDDTTDDYESSTTVVEEGVDVTTVENDVDATEVAITRKDQPEVPETLYSRIKSALSSRFCLERIGCHMAIYTRVFRFYNEFILRILDNLSVPMNESKFVSYKDAYQIGSLNDTDHGKCAALYYCKKIDGLIIKNNY